VKAFGKTDISRLELSCAYSCFPEDTTYEVYEVLLTEMVSTNNSNLIKTVTAICEKTTILFFDACLKGTYFSG
jgi:hypothetical protein